MPKSITDPLKGDGKQITVISASPTQPKTTPDVNSVISIAGSYGVFNSDSGREVARFDSFGDALNEVRRRNAIDAGRPL